jgi:uncharacterized paraquat-inducible protein A
MWRFDRPNVSPFPRAGFRLSVLVLLIAPALAYVIERMWQVPIDDQVQLLGMLVVMPVGLLIFLQLCRLWAWKVSNHGRSGLGINVREREMHCTTCGYDLRASKDRCPECGTSFPKKGVIPLPQWMNKRR